MASKSNLKTCFDIESKNGAFFTGGKVNWTKDGSVLFCQSAGVVNLIDVELGRVKLSLGDSDNPDADVIQCFAATPDGSQLVTSHKSGLFKLWDTSEGAALKSWKAIHQGPVASVHLMDDGSQLASGGSDSVVRVWDLQHHSCTHALRGASGVISVVQFHEGHVYGCGDDLNITCWSLATHHVAFQLTGHYSKVTSISFHHGGQHLASSGRDKVVILWDLHQRAAVRTLPVFEALETVVCLPHKFELPVVGEVSGGVHVATAGEKGAVKVFELTGGKQVFVQEDSLVSAAEEGGLAVTQLLWSEARNCLAAVTADHNIVLHDLATFRCVKQLVGFTDEILDVALLGPQHSHLAVATNSADLKLYNAAHMGCQLMRGHTDLVVALAVTPADLCLLASGSKDNTVRLWRLDVATQSTTCVAVGAMHAASVTAACLPRLSAAFLLTAGQDSTLKVWRLQLQGPAPAAMTVAHTQPGHDKDVNCVCVSPNDKLAATASQDKTIKVWSAEDLTLLGTLRGHRRGVWAVRFSPVDQVLLSASADTTLKLWSVADMTCLKSLEGHDSSVLRCEFLSRGMQVLSCSGDGLVKLWSVKSGECSATLEGHSGRVWALAVSDNEDRLVTGGSDSLLILWKDTTLEKKEAAIADRERALLMEQRLANLVNSGQLVAALSLALQLDRPFQVLNIITDLTKSDQTADLRDSLRKLTDEEKEKLLGCAAVWNANSRNCASAQLVISVLLDEVASGSLQAAGLSAHIEQLLPYTERHMKRLTGMLQDLHLLHYTVARMKPAAT